MKYINIIDINDNYIPLLNPVKHKKKIKLISTTNHHHLYHHIHPLSLNNGQLNQYYHIIGKVIKKSILSLNKLYFYIQIETYKDSTYVINVQLSAKWYIFIHLLHSYIFTNLLPFTLLYAANIYRNIPISIYKSDENNTKVIKVDSQVLSIMKISLSPQQSTLGFQQSTLGFQQREY